MSPDLKDVLIAAIPSIIPTVMVGFGILINKNDINRVSGEISALRVEVHNDLNAMRNQFHADLDKLTGAGYEMDKRVSR
jgi:hypothetical protein